MCLICFEDIKLLPKTFFSEALCFSELKHIVQLKSIKFEKKIVI